MKSLSSNFRVSSFSRGSFSKNWIFDELPSIALHDLHLLTCWKREKALVFKRLVQSWNIHCNCAHTDLNSHSLSMCIALSACLFCVRAHSHKNITKTAVSWPTAITPEFLCDEQAHRKHKHWVRCLQAVRV